MRRAGCQPRADPTDAPEQGVKASEVLGSMLFTLFSIVWLALLMFSLSLCRAAARGDNVRAVRRPERIVIGYLDEHDGVLVGTAERLPHDSQ
jgi:hypothetical protein